MSYQPMPKSALANVMPDDVMSVMHCHMLYQMIACQWCQVIWCVNDIFAGDVMSYDVMPNYIMLNAIMLSYIKS